jgi:hypothetical protein
LFKGNSMKTSFLSLFLMVSASSALADLKVDFIEGAPKDRFVISNKGKCALGAGKVTVDLTDSAGRLIFDVTEQGKGVEVFQPFELISGKEALVGLPTVRDGDKVVILNVKELKAGNQIAFTIDVDDTIGAREITVSNAEIEGASAIFESAGKVYSANFGAKAKALIKQISCTG